jgi:hypothetical protein
LGATLTLAAAAIVALCRCGAAQVVIVTDDNGAPVAGAQVDAVSLSINMHARLTDGDGKAALPSNPQGTRWIQVSKSGFVPEQVDLPEQWPAHVTLHAAPQLEVHFHHWDDLRIDQPRESDDANPITKAELATYLDAHCLAKALVRVALDKREAPAGLRVPPAEIAAFFHERGFKRVLITLATGAFKGGPLVVLDSVDEAPAGVAPRDGR